MATTIQSAWRGHRARKWIEMSRLRLPDDLWEHIVRFISKQDEFEMQRQIVRRVCALRVLRLRLGPGLHEMLQRRRVSPELNRRIFSTIRLTQKYVRILDLATVQNACNIATRLIHAERRFSPVEYAYINALLETALHRNEPVE